MSAYDELKKKLEEVEETLTAKVNMLDGRTRDRLRALLSSSAKVVSRDNPDYECHIKQFGYYLDTKSEAEQKLSPELIVIPCNENDVKATVKFASMYDHTIVVRSGGHSYRATSSTNGQRTIQIDMQNFTDVSFEESVKENTRSNFDVGKTRESYKVRVGPGVRLLGLNTALKKFNCFIPAGMCMNVAAGGHFQSSSMGLFTKAFGRGFDYLTHIKIVLANGETVVTSKNNNSDLFWALRGGSPGAFGIVLEYQFDALNGFQYSDVLFGMLRTWEYTEENAQKILPCLFRLTSSKDYLFKKNMVLNMAVVSDKREGCVLCEPKHIIHVWVIWCGVDNGSIYSVIPDELREQDTPAGESFYDYYISTLKTIPGEITSLSKEICGINDANVTLSRVAVDLSTGCDNAGDPQRVYNDHKITMRLSRQGRGWNDSLADKKVQQFDIDLNTEQVRYINASRHTKTWQFDHLSFIQKFIEQHRILKSCPHIGVMTQLTFNGMVKESLNGCPKLSTGIFRYDSWGLWKESSGEKIANIVKVWSAALDENFQKCLLINTQDEDHFGTGHLAFPNEQNDLSYEIDRQRYYPDKNEYDRLTAVKRFYDPHNLFQTTLTVPLASDEVFKRWRDLRVNEKTRSHFGDSMDSDVKWFGAYAGSNILTVVGQVEHNALAQPNEIFLNWIDDRGTQNATTFKEFRDLVMAKASWLQHHMKIEKGDRIVLTLLPGPGFIVALIACMYIGAVPVPTYPVDILGNQGSNHSQKFRSIVRAVKPKFILADGSILPHRLKASFLGNFFSTCADPIPWVIAGSDNQPVGVVQIGLDDDAIIQYTSGTTTGTPKGALLTHGNLLSQFLIIDDSYEDKSEVRGFAWVPTYHDLGLFMAILTSIVNGFTFTSMSPTVFLKDPLLWFSYLSKYRITHTAGPNFAFSLCLDTLQRKGMQALTGLDLSSVESLGSGGEPIDTNTMDSLLRILHDKCGLRKESFTPCYGVAEAGCSVTIGGSQVSYLDRGALCSSMSIKHVSKSADNNVAVYGCGDVKDDSVIVVGINGNKLEEDTIGEIWVCTPSLACRYVESEQSTALNNYLPYDKYARWFASGDLGFIKNKVLFVLGRKCELMTIGTKHVFAYQMEHVVNKVGNFRKGNTTAYILDDPISNKGKLEIAVELKGEQVISRADLAGLINKKIRGVFELDDKTASVVHFIPQRSAFRTTSGKLERQLTGRAIESGTIPTTSFEF